MRRRWPRLKAGNSRGFWSSVRIAGDLRAPPPLPGAPGQKNARIRGPHCSRPSRGQFGKRSAHGVPPLFVPEQGHRFLRDRARIRERNQYSAPLRKQFRGMPVRRGDHRFARPERVGQRARRDLRLVEVRSDVNVRRAYEFLEIVEIDELIEKITFLSTLFFLASISRLRPVSLAVPAQFTGMGRAEDDINDFGNSCGSAVRSARIRCPCLAKAGRM